jgi:hypothetical protein
MYERKKDEEEEEKWTHAVPLWGTEVPIWLKSS